MIFNNYLDIDLHFQNSINIGLDLYDSKKINSYIPTSTGLDFLNHFIDNILSNNGENSSMLIAPYGKGKSHAILVLLSLLAKRNYDSMNVLLNKIAKIDPQLSENINKIKNKKYLSIIISNTRGTLNQALISSLQKALDNNEINDIVLKTDFQLVLDRIDEWKKIYPDTHDEFVKSLIEQKVSYSNFIKEIKSYNEYALEIFKTTHKKILSGADFNTNNSLEIVDYYQEVTDKLITNYGYDGVYIIFDEFSKFLESRDENTITNDMKIIQDLAELCNSSKNSQMNLMLVLHKPINDYLSVDKNIRNAFKGIEGRVSPYYFTTSLKNSFDLIGNALNKKDEYQEIEQLNQELNELITKQINNIPGFYVDLDQEYRDTQLIDALYPLHPITAYLLVKINEKVAQNERTLFTFLAKKAAYSLPTLISKEYQYPYIIAPTIFDYFKVLLLEEKDNVNIHNITATAMSALKLVRNKEQKNFIKTLALLLIVNEKDLMPTNISIFSSALLLTPTECEDIITELINKGILVQRHGGQLQFKINMDLNINSVIDNLVHTKFVKINLEKELKEISENKFIYPKSYNINNSITRYYETEYISEKDFLKLNSTTQYFENDYKDGLILNVLRERDKNDKKIRNHTLELNNDRVVVIYPDKYSDYENNVKKLLAVDSLLNDKNFIDENHLIRQELEMLYGDLKVSILESLSNDYSLMSDNSHLFNTYNNNELIGRERLLSKNRILGQIFEHIFNMYPVVNLELINKWNVTGSYKAAREKVSDKLISNTLDFNNLGTSPEDTIVNCVLVETGIVGENEMTPAMNEVMNQISNFMNGNSGEFKDLYDLLTRAPYGMRKGVLPILISLTLGLMNHSVLIHFKNQEIELTGKTIELINAKPNEYSFTIDEQSAEKEQYLNELAMLFHCELTNDSIKNYSILTSTIQNWYFGLPKLSKQMIGKDEAMNNKSYKLLKKYLSQSNLNPSEFILKTLLKITECDDFACVEKLSQMKIYLDEYLSEYLKLVKREINTILDFEPDTVLKQSISFWIGKHRNNLESRVLDDATKQFVLLENQIDNENEKSLINKIAYFFTSLFIEDWSENTIDLFVSQFRQIKNYENQNDIVRDENQVTLQIGDKQIVKSFIEELDDSAELLENIIVDAIDDYGDVLSNEQRLALLVKVMKKYI